MKETDVMDMIKNELSYRKDIQIFRNNVGVGAAYNFQTRSLRRPLQIIRYGVASTSGGSDYIGYKTIKVTPEMVGKNVAVFLAIEAKNPKKYILSEEQKLFLNEVNRSGGIGIVVKNNEDLKEIL